MQNDLISRSALIEKMNDTGVQITFDLPVEEILGNDVDFDDFTMLVQDAIQAYRKMVIGAIQNQPTAYDVEKVVECVEALPVQDFLGVDHIPRTAALNMIKRNGNCELPEASQIDRLSGDYIRGYTKAIQDIKLLVIEIHDELKSHRIRWSEKIINGLFDCILEHRAKLREQRNGFIRWNVVLKKFEWFEPEEE